MDTSIKIKTDTTIVAKDSVPVNDSIIKKRHDPAKATRRSAIIPGWGQAYNKQYWKIPLVYAALGITAATYVYNDKWYKKTRDAYEIVINEDTANYDQIDPKLKGLIAYPESLQYYRNDFRRSRDYSILFFLIAWGLNVVDATVYGHLKDFDVSDDLSMRIKPTFDFKTKTRDWVWHLTLKAHSTNLYLCFNFCLPAFVFYGIGGCVTHLYIQLL
jgi:hypothetical protein